MDTEIKNILLNEAEKAYKKGEIPVGSVIIKNNEIISKAYNVKEEKQNPLMHAELIAIDKACQKLKNWRLDDCEMIVTLQPCPMCASAIKQSRIGKVSYFVEIADDRTRKIVEEIFNVVDNNRKTICEKIECVEYEKMWKKFFQNIRK